MATIQEKKREASRIRRQRRTRLAIQGKTNLLRLSVNRSNKHMAVQIIDDILQKTVVAAHDREIGDAKVAPIKKAMKLGELIALKAKKKNITKIVFDRRQYRYLGRVRAVAEGARKGGLQF